MLMKIKNYDFFYLYDCKEYSICATIARKSESDAWKFFLDLFRKDENLIISNGSIYWKNYTPVYCRQQIEKTEPITAEEKMTFWKESHIANRDKDQKNPYKIIKVKPLYYGLGREILLFLSDLLSGYIWECEEGSSFIAVHEELAEVKKLKIEIDNYLKNQTFHGDPILARRLNTDDFETRLFIKFSLLLPSLWD